MAEDKKKSRADRMYGNSPKLTKGEDGKVGITKAMKERDGTDGVEQHESGHDMEMKEMMNRHSEERMKLHHKHELEMHEHLVKKATAHDQSHEKAEEKSGKKTVEKVEGDKKTGDE